MPRVIRRTEPKYGVDFPLLYTVHSVSDECIRPGVGYAQNENVGTFPDLLDSKSAPESNRAVTPNFDLVSRVSS